MYPVLPQPFFVEPCSMFTSKLESVAKPLRYCTARDAIHPRTCSLSVKNRGSGWKLLRSPFAVLSLKWCWLWALNPFGVLVIVDLVWTCTKRTHPKKGYPTAAYTGQNGHVLGIKTRFSDKPKYHFKLFHTQCSAKTVQFQWHAAWVSSPPRAASPTSGSPSPLEQRSKKIGRKSMKIPQKLRGKFKLFYLFAGVLYRFRNQSHMKHVTFSHSQLRHALIERQTLLCQEGHHQRQDTLSCDLCSRGKLQWWTYVHMWRKQQASCVCEKNIYNIHYSFTRLYMYRHIPV